MAGSRELERDVNEVEHNRQLCRPMEGSATMSCVDDQNLNRELVTVDISESLAQVQELGVSSHELATCEGAEMNFLSKDTIILSRFARALWSVQCHKLWA